MTLSLVSRSLPSEWAKDNTSYSNNQFFHTGSQHYYTENKRQLCARCTYIIILYGQLI